MAGVDRSVQITENNSKISNEISLQMFQLLTVVADHEQLVAHYLKRNNVLDEISQWSLQMADCKARQTRKMYAGPFSRGEHYQYAFKLKATDVDDLSTTKFFSYNNQVNSMNFLQYFY